jgi:hypothetical protein
MHMMTSGQEKSWPAVEAAVKGNYQGPGYRVKAIQDRLSKIRVGALGNFG